MEENNSVFRKKSLDRISSPEDLDKYIKTTTPSLWLLLLAVIIFLAGVIVWGVVGKIETASPVGCKMNGTVMECYVKEEEIELITSETYVEIAENKYEIKSVGNPLEADETADSYMLHNSEINEGEWYCIITLKGTLNNENSKGRIVFEQISPIKFVIN